MDWWTIQKSWLRHLDLGPLAIPEALGAAFGNLGSTFGPSKTMSEPQKIENKKNRKIILTPSGYPPTGKGLGSLICVLNMPNDLGIPNAEAWEG